MRRLSSALLLALVACAPASKFDVDGRPVIALPSRLERCALSAAGECYPFDFDACAADDSITECVEAAEFDCVAARRCYRVIDADAGTREFSAGPYGNGITQLAAPFTIQTEDGTFDLAAEWTGAESFIFFAGDPGYFVLNSFQQLITMSPRNVHYVFGWPGTTAPASFFTAKSAFVDHLFSLPDADAAHWLSHVHFLAEPITSLPAWRNPGFAIDRHQRLRELGMLGVLTSGGTTADLTFLSRLAHSFNFEATRQQRLDAQQNVTVLTLADRQVMHDNLYIDVTLPDVSAFDTLEVDLALECPEHLRANCGAWDYLSHLWLCEPVPAADGGTEWDCDNKELARWITPYWAEGRWVTDISHQLPALTPGPARLRFYATGQWDPRTTDYITSLSFRYFNQGRDAKPSQLIPLWKGGETEQSGDWNYTYDSKHPPRDVVVPAGAKRVELVFIVTGHQGVSGTNCAEFCSHTHHFSVNGAAFTKGFPEAQTTYGCADRVNEGVVPNQSGTWYYGRGGWCPGHDVPAVVFDVTNSVAKGSSNTFEYTTSFNGQALTEAQGGQGNIHLSSWLAVWE